MTAFDHITGMLALFVASFGGVSQLGESVASDRVQVANRGIGEQQPHLVLYKSTPERNLFVHVFAPDDKVFPGKRPAILFFHGGGWVEGDARRFYDQARHLAALGMVAISADYRIKSIDNTDPKTALADAISAMRFVRTQSDELGIDSTRIAAGGGSAGGQLAAALATANGFGDPIDDPGISKEPSALILFNPVIDNGPDGYGFQRVRAYWQDFSPIHNIRTRHPPTIILLGTADKLIPVETGKQYCEKVRSVGSSCQLHLYEGQPHAFFNRRRSDLHFQMTMQVVEEFLLAMEFIDQREGAVGARNASTQESITAIWNHRDQTASEMSDLDNLQLKAACPLTAPKLPLTSRDTCNDCQTLAPLTSATRASTFDDLSKQLETIPALFRCLISASKRTRF